MTKSTLKPATKAIPAGAPSKGRLAVARTAQAEPISKQARVLEMLRSPTGATITGIAQATGWQQHSVRGFLAGVVRKRLGLNLQSKTVDDRRTYRIVSGAKVKQQATKKRRV